MPCSLRAELTISHACWRVEFALDALLNITEYVLLDDEQCGWEYDDLKEQIEAYPSTPLDGSFEIAFFMCVNRGGGSLQSRGPMGGHSTPG